MRAYIQSYRTISHLDSFESGIIRSTDHHGDGTLRHPEYKEFIPAAMIRRMSKVIRMGVGLAIAVKGDKEIKGIIVGTGLGCLENTEKFMDQFVQKKEGILAPTNFIQSTHNTIAGQIGLILKDNCYNSTYTQRGLSFENALLDAVLLSMETEGNVVVGGIDEKIELMKVLGEKAGINTESIGAGGSFFLVGQNKEDASAEIVACSNVSLNNSDIDGTVKTFLLQNGLDEPSLYLHGNSFIGSQAALTTEIKSDSYSTHSGEYMTNSAFGLQMATELLLDDNELDSICVVNNFADKDLGLIYIQRP